MRITESRELTMMARPARHVAGSMFVYVFAVFLVAAGLMVMVKPALSAPILPVALLVGLSTAVIYVSSLKDLLASDRKFRGLVSSMDDVVLILDADGRYCEVVPTSAALLYKSIDELSGKLMHEVMPKENADFFLDRIRTVLGRKRTERVEYCLPIGDKVVWFEAAVSPLTDHEVIWVARDMTARHRAEEMMQRSQALLEEAVLERTRELRRSRNLLSEAQRIARVGSWDANVRTGEVWWSDELYRILGVEKDRAPLSLELFESMVVPEDLGHHREAMERVSQPGSVESEVQVETSDGQRKTIHLIVSKKGEGRLTGTVQDVTEARAAERRIRESEGLFRWLGRATNDVTWDWDLASDGLSWDEGICHHFGYAPGQIENHISSFPKLIHPEDRDRVAAHINEVIASGESLYSDEYRFLTAAGTFAYVLDRGYVIRNADGRAVRMVGAMSDYTERKSLETRLEQEKRVSSLGHLAASIAHEVNNVLMGIQPNVELIGRRSSGRFDSTIENILTAVRRGKRVTETILSYTRSSEPCLESFEVGPFLRSWSEELRPSLGSAIGLDLTFGSEDLCLNADRMQMGQVLANLATNACDAMNEKGGTLSIHVERASDADSVLYELPNDDHRYVHIRVSDTGVGIPSRNLKMIFDPFFTTRQRGTGLGLAISRQIVQVHGGRIVAESEPGKGTTFHLFIPQGVPTVRTIGSRPVARPVGLDRVVMVEDEESVAAGLSSLFEIEGIAVEHVMLGRDTFDAIERFRPDVVILDVGLPDMDGSDVFLEVSRRWPGLPVVFSSGHADVMKLKSYVSQPNVEFIQKPYDFDLLMQRIGSVLKWTVESDATAACSPIARRLVG